MKYELTAIAKIRTDFPTKFGVPRQSGLVKGLKGRIVFEPEFRDPEALRGLEGFSHIWLLWDFSEARKESSKSPLKGETSFAEGEGRGGSFRPTVRPPRLGGNRRMGVWATRSPFRPNSIGLSSVRIVGIHLHTPDGPVVEVEGADLMDGTPIFDLKPYLAYSDSHPDARCGFVGEHEWKPLQVVIPDSVARLFDTGQQQALQQVLAQDPRPRYHDDPDRQYGMPFAGYDVRFTVANGVVSVTEAVKTVKKIAKI